MTLRRSALTRRTPLARIVGSTYPPFPDSALGYTNPNGSAYSIKGGYSGGQRTGSVKEIVYEGATSSAHTIYFFVQNSNNDTYRSVSPLMTNQGLGINTYAVDLTIQTDDYIGFWVPSGTPIYYRANQTGVTAYYRDNAIVPSVGASGPVIIFNSSTVFSIVGFG